MAYNELDLTIGGKIPQVVVSITDTVRATGNIYLLL